MIKQLHFLPWSGYFTERIVDKIRSYSFGDSFIIWKPQIQIKNTIAIYSFQDLLHFVNSNCDRHTKFITHSLVIPVAILLGMTKWKNNLSSWITWGAEYNSIIRISNKHTNNACKGKSGLLNKVTSFIRVKAISNINTILSTPGEIKLLRTALYVKSLYTPHHSYFNLEELSNVSEPIKENTLLIGNSNDLSNQHIEAIEWVNNQNYKGNILIPLPEAPLKYLYDIAVKVKDHNFSATILNKTIKPEKFEKLISKCTYALMYHERQQAMLTIYILLWHGTKVFLRAANPLVELFREWNIHFEIIENIRNADCWIPLSTSEVKHNKEIIFQVLSKEIISEQYHKYLS